MTHCFHLFLPNYETAIFVKIQLTGKFELFCGTFPCLERANRFYSSAFCLWVITLSERTTYKNENDLYILVSQLLSIIVFKRYFLDLLLVIVNNRFHGKVWAKNLLLCLLIVSLFLLTLLLMEGPLR